MSIDLIIIGVILLFFGYVIGVQERIELVSFIKNKNVKDKEKVAQYLGGSQIILGAICITLGGSGFNNAPLVAVCILIILFITSIYVVKKYVC
ncbi:hypothetical protein AAGS61_08225 [Lysinibacillus sp. KU-BSD001]|uniref:hypothetical protein n=1 Tax=Lysinibacillus sp. KU-BSD001 TaxID=3141328 RepID=UPI0036EC9B2A